MISEKPQHRLLLQIDLRVLLPIFGVLLIGLLWIGLVYQLSFDRANALKDARTTSQSMTNAFSEHSLNILRQIDFAEQIFKLNYEANKAQYPIKDFLRINGVMNLALPPDIETLVMVLDAKGQLIDSSQPFEATSYAGQEFFVKHTERTTDATIVTKPVIDARSGRWHVQLSRRLNHADGGFAGVVLMQLNPADLIDYFESFDAENQGAAVLVSPIEKYSVRRVGELLIFEHTDFGTWLDPYHEKSVSDMLAAGELDGARRIFYSRTLAEFSLMAMVGVTEKDALARYNDRRKTYIWIASGISLLLVGFIGVLIFQTRRLHRSRASAASAQKLFRAAADGSLDALFILQSKRDVSGKITDFIVVDINDRAAILLGLQRDEIVGRNASELMPVHLTKRMMERYAGVIESGNVLEEEFAINPDNPYSTWMQHQIIRIEDGIAVTTRDITKRRHAALALAESESRLRIIANTVPAMVAYVDADQILRFANMAFERDTAYVIDGLLGRHLRDIVSIEHYAFLAPFITRALQGETLTFEEERERDGNLRSLETTFVPQFSDGGDRVVGFHFMSQDITSTKIEKRRLQSLVSLDSLTGLSNRNGFQIELDAAMSRCCESAHLMALMYIDIDRFKPVNDTHGHNVGDALLRAFSSRLIHSVRSTDTVSRLGGDEFTIILDKVSKPEDATMIAKKIVESMRMPFELDHIVVAVSASVGVAFYQGSDITSEELIRRADVMLYQAKEAGRDTYCVAAQDEQAST